MTTIGYTPAAGYTPVSLTINAQTVPGVLAEGVWTFTFTTPPDGTYTGIVSLTGPVSYEDTITVTLPLGRLVTPDQAIAYMGCGADDTEEIARYCEAANDVVQNLCGPTLIRRTFTETVCGTKLLSHWPVISAEADGTVLPVYSDSVTTYSAQTVTYVAGLPQVPVQAVDAALIYVSYRYRRNHGGSESFMPAGVDGAVVTPMGIQTLENQMRFALGSLARGPAVA